MTTSPEVATVALTPEVAERVAKVARGLEVSLSEVVNEVLARHLDEYVWKALLRYGHARGRASGYGPEDVPRLVEEVRAEMAAERAAEQAERS